MLDYLDIKAIDLDTGLVQTENSLYRVVGVPGKKAPKQEGVEIIKQQRFRLEQPLTDAEAAILTEALGAMMGIKHIETEGNTISITYDLIQATAEQIETRIGQVGTQLGAGWRERLQRGFVYYFEECEVGNGSDAPLILGGIHSCIRMGACSKRRAR